MTELNPGRARPVLDRRLKAVRMVRDLVNYMDNRIKGYEAYIKGLFEAQKADSYQGSGVSATYKPVPRRSLDPLKVLRDYPLEELARQPGLMHLQTEGFLEFTELTEEQAEPYFTEGSPSSRLDIKVEPVAASRIKRQLNRLVAGFQAKRKTAKPGRKKAD